ncbi:MAG: hypothetical protein ACXW5U_17385 [Thermoanaerobaculia bacterium]
MPSTPELIALLIAILVLWVVLKLAKVAIKLFFFLIVVAIIVGALWLFLPR